MSLRYEMGIGIPSTYGNSLAQKPRDMQTREKPSEIEKPVLKDRNNVNTI